METGDHFVAKGSSYLGRHMNGGLGTCRKDANQEYAAIPVRQSCVSQQACNVSAVATG